MLSSSENKSIYSFPLLSKSSSFPNPGNSGGSATAAAAVVNHQKSNSLSSNHHSTILLYEFRWKYGGNKVILTGNFDHWQSSIKMTQDSLTGYYIAYLKLDATQKWNFKFIVDAIWRCSMEFPTEVDPLGNVNNVFYPLLLPKSLASSTSELNSTSSVEDGPSAKGNIFTTDSECSTTNK